MNSMLDTCLCFGNWLSKEDLLLLNEVNGWKVGLGPIALTVCVELLGWEEFQFPVLL